MALEGLGQFLATNQNWQQGLSTIANESQQEQLIRAKMQEQQQTAQKESAVRAALAGTGGELTPDSVYAALKDIDPILAVELAGKVAQSQAAAQKATAPDLKFNPVTGELVKIEGTRASTVPIDGVDMSASPGVETAPSGIDADIPSEIAANPKARQVYIEKKATDAAETTSKESTKNKSRDDFSKSLVEMRALIDRLDTKGGMINANAPLNKNLMNAVKLTDTGQLIMRGAGDETQSIVDEINNHIPILMRDIKNATGLSAQEINSIPEMQLLKNSVGNPKSSYQTIIGTLKRLDSKYGAGKAFAEPGDREAMPGESGLRKPSRSEVEAELRRRGLLK